MPSQIHVLKSRNRPDNSYFYEPNGDFNAFRFQPQIKIFGSDKSSVALCSSKFRNVMKPMVCLCTLNN